MQHFSAAFAAIIVLLATGGVVQTQAQKGGGDSLPRLETLSGLGQVPIATA